MELGKVFDAHLADELGVCSGGGRQGGRGERGHVDVAASQPVGRLAMQWWQRRQTPQASLDH